MDQILEKLALDARYDLIAGSGILIDEPAPANAFLADLAARLEPPGRCSHSENRAIESIEKFLIHAPEMVYEIALINHHILELPEKLGLVVNGSDRCERDLFYRLGSEGCGIDPEISFPGFEKLLIVLLQDLF